MHEIRGENCVLFGEISEDLSPEGSLSNGSEGLLEREEPGYMSQDVRVLQQQPGSQSMKRLLSIKENEPSQGNEFSTFLCMGRCKSLTH